MTQQGDWDIVTDVGISALAVAAARAIESHRPNRLMSDPYAELFVAAAKPPTPMPTRPADIADGSPWPDMADYMGVRSRFFDEFLGGSSAQAVLLAAGLDARGYRLDWPSGAVVYELDMPKVLRFKQSVLDDHGVTPRATIRPVGVDLRDDWPTALLGSGFDRATPSAWLAEGLLPYLPDDAMQRLFTLVDQLSAPGSRLAAEHTDRDIRELATRGPLASMAKESGLNVTDMVPGGKVFAPVRWLAEHGWRVTSTSIGPVAEGYGRPLGPNAGGLHHSVLITATKA